MSLHSFAHRFLVISGLAGAACYACATAPGEPPSLSSVSPSDALQGEKAPHIQPSLQETTGASSDAASSEKGLVDLALVYQESINLASSAYNLGQSAVSPDDWDLVASRWKQAVERLKQIPSQDPNYANAQRKIAEYTRNAEYAQTKIADLQSAVAIGYPSASAAARSEQSIHASGWATHSRGAESTGDRSSAVGTNPSANQAEDNTSHLPAPRRVSVPIARRLHGTPVVQVTFNRDRTYEMILDTGASRTLITRAMARELGVQATERMVAATASEAEVSFDLGQLRSIEMGGIVLENARVSIGDSVEIGLLGNDFLSGYDVTIRDREQVIELATTQ